MRIVYVSQYFPPEMGAPSARVHELSRAWVRMGHQVTVLTGFAHHPVGVKAPRDRGVLTRRETCDGIDVVRSYVYAAPNKGSARRMLSYASFMLSAMAIGPVRLPRPDVVIATSPQLLCAPAGYFIARLLRVPFVFEVRDLWPEATLAVDAMKPTNLIFRSLRRLADFLYRRCERIVTVGPGYKDGIVERYHIPADKIDVIPNGIDTSVFEPLPRAQSLRQELGWGDRFVLMYVGTHGMAHGLHHILEAADALRGEPQFLFVFIGEGAEKARLKQIAADKQLPNVQFIDQQPKERIRQFYGACDLGLVTLRRDPLLQDSLPSKLFEYLGMERPVLLAVGGEARRIVEESGGGQYVPPEDVPALTAAIRRLCQQREALPAMGRSGRAYVLEKYDRRVLARSYADILAAVCAASRR
jgi:colanic acid biosynthesis glycosyl transferase WcaI